MYIKLHSFNCRGLQDYVKRRKIFHYFRSLNCDILFLQETHCSREDEKLWHSQWGEHAFFASFTSNSRGVAILIRNSINLKVKSIFRDPNGRFLILNSTLNELPLTLVNVYAPNNDDSEFLLHLFAEINKFDVFSLLVAGDFNAVLGPLDYQGSRNKHSNIKASEMLSALMDEFALCDIWRFFNPNLKKYTRHQKTPQVLSRLDFILVSDNFVNNCKETKILPGINSDHSTVSVCFNDNQPPRGRGYWKLNTYYLYHDTDFIDLIKEKIKDFKIIHKDSQCDSNILWDSLKCFITGVAIEYSARKKRERNKEKNELLESIDKIKSKLSNNSVLPDDPLYSQLEELEDKLNKIFDFETKGLIIRSRVKWLEEGEKSTKYFCNLENRSWQKKNINKLKDNDNNLITDSKDILNNIYEFYSKLYSVPNTDFDNEACETYLNNISIPLLHEDDKQLLEAPLTKNEIFNVVKSMKKNKTPGLDGLPIEFYIVFWSDICDMLVNSFNFSLQNGLMSASQRNGIITLLPKKDKDPLLVKNYRPITLLTTDYKILAKCIANRLKRCLDYLIHVDQSGFLQGRNIGHNIRFILDIIEYAEAYDIPGSIILLDIEKAFDSVSHDFLFKILEKFNFGHKFIDSIKTLYSARQSYVINNGFLSNRIFMNRGIFQGCPISPYLFLLVIEIMALSVRQNDLIRGISLVGEETKISLFADDSVCFIDGSNISFSQLFETLSNFGQYSGCKLNFSKTEAIWIGAKKGCLDFPFTSQGVSWQKSEFNCLGVKFSLNVHRMFDLNFNSKLNRIEQTLNCWRMRNLSLIGKVCVVKTLVLPQLIFLFSVLCIRIPRSFFQKLNTIFFRFIWNGGKDRVQRQIVCNNYAEGGLKMIDPLSFANAQKLVWVKHLLDVNFIAPWKSIELSFLQKFNAEISFLWNSFAPENILNSLGSTQLAESLRAWYIYREVATVEFYGHKFSDLSACQCLWYNRLIRSKSKSCLFYESWFDNNILTMSDLFNPPLTGHKLFEELVLDFGIPLSDRRKFNFLIKNIPEKWIRNFDKDIFGVHETIVQKLLSTKKVPKNAYDILIGSHVPDKRYQYWGDKMPVPVNLDWEKIHISNYFCTIDTKLRSFYFKIFHKAIALNQFLYKINRRDSPKCSLCDTGDETMIHLFCECDKVTSIWQGVLDVISQKCEIVCNVTNFEKLFGICSDKFVTYLFLLVKYYIYTCKFNNSIPNFTAFKCFVRKQKEVEYFSAKKRNKLPVHFKKWRFDL